MRSFRVILTLTFLLLFLPSSRSQQPFSAAANQLFDAGKYREAIAMYRQLLERFPEDASYNYKLGVCYFQTKEDLNLAYKYLKAASTKEVTTKVYFYLGEVCRYLYRFDESLGYYKRFMVSGGAADIPTITIEMAASAAANGQNMLKYTSKVEPIAKATVDAESFFKAYDTYPANAGFGELPASLKTPIDVKRNLRSLIFSRMDGGSVGDVAVFASFGQGETNSKDLFYIQKIDDRTWSRPKRLPSSINSPFDEDFAYMAPDNKTLYFASKGIYSVGGFDIYRTIFNAEKDEWSAPENLGFPINSPYDDYLLVPASDGASACFVSSRSAKEDGKLTLYKVGGLANSIRVEVTPEKALLMQDLVKQTEPTAVQPSEEDKDGAPQLRKGIMAIPQYRQVKYALRNNEVLIDSTTRKIDRLRSVWADLPDSTRSDVERLIVFNEKKLQELNDINEKLVSQASALEKDFLSGKLTAEPLAPTVVKDWFVTDDRLSSFYSAQQLKRLGDLAIPLPKLLTTVDSSVTLYQQIVDLAQIVEVADSTERKVALSKISKGRKEVLPLLALLDDAWPKTYNAYFEVLNEVGDQVQQELHGDSTLLLVAKQSHLTARAIRNGVTVSTNSLDDFGKLVEAYQSEQKAIYNQLLYLAKVVGSKDRTDSLLKVLAKYEVKEPEKAEERSGSTNGEFGQLKRTEVAIEEIKFAAPTATGELTFTNGPSYSSQNPMPTVKSLTNGVVYSIQLGSFSQQLVYAQFRLTPMFYESAGAVKKVYAGIFSSYASAQARLSAVRESGFKDAFIVAFYEKKQVALAKAKQLEAKGGVGEGAGTAMFRVVVGSFAGEMPKNIKDIVEKLLSDKEIIKSTMSDAQTAYSIGNFDTFEQAVALKDKLVAEGIVEAFVTKIEINQPEQQQK